MSEGLNLPRLHQLLQQLQAVRDKLSGGPRQIRVRESRIAQGEQLALKRTEELKLARAAADSKNLELKSKEAGLLDLQRKLNVSTSNREYDAAQTQIDADKAAKAVLEDEILELLDRAEGIQKEIARAKEAVSQAQADLEKFRAEFDSQADQWRQQQAKLEKEVAAAESAFTGQDKDKYRRLVDAYHADALADADTGNCSNCYVNLTPQQRVQLNSGKHLFCGTCGRLLYINRG